MFAYFAPGDRKFRIGSIEEVIPLPQKAIRISPRDPYIGYFYNMIAFVDLLQSRTDEAIVWTEGARNANPARPYLHAILVSAYALKGDVARAGSELAEARSLNAAYSCIARNRATFTCVPKICALREATVYTGLRRAGMPEE
jgi:hypothetical protein